MAYTVNNFKSGDTLYASQLNKMDAQIIQNEIEIKELKSQIDDIVIEGGGLTLNRVYPVGSIYMSINSTDPTSLFGGTWEQLPDRFLLGAGATYTAGATGGSATHKLTVSEMPAHTHSVIRKVGTAADGNDRATLNSEGSSLSGVVGSTGGSQAHNNMPPYLAVYMWKRVA